jgi:hypothetical protein
MALSARGSTTRQREPELFQRSRARGEAVREQNATPDPTNVLIADKLHQAADILAAQRADPFRVAAYRKAADSVLALTEDLGTVVGRSGRNALEAIPGIGVSIASPIVEMLATGRWSFLEHLKGSAEPEKLFCSIPGIGAALADRVSETLHIRTLEALEVAAHDGRLEGVPGFARRRVAMVRTALAEMLGRIRRRPLAGGEEPAAGLLLDVDRDYRTHAAEGELPKIAPKRFNPTGEARLRCCIPFATAGTSPRSTPIPPAPISLGASRTGWSSTSTGTAGQKANARSSPKLTARREGTASSAVARWSALLILLPVELEARRGVRAGQPRAGKSANRLVVEARCRHGTDPGR